MLIHFYFNTYSAVRMPQKLHLSGDGIPFISDIRWSNASVRHILCMAGGALKFHVLTFCHLLINPLPTNVENMVSSE